MTVTIDDEVQARFQAVAAPDEDFSAFLAAVCKGCHCAPKMGGGRSRRDAGYVETAPGIGVDPDADLPKIQRRHLDPGLMLPMS